MDRGTECNVRTERSVAAPAPDPAREMVLTRTFDAPRDLVFALWTAHDSGEELITRGR